MTHVLPTGLSLSNPESNEAPPAQKKKKDELRGNMFNLQRQSKHRKAL